ncbi:MAG: branched-chain amino acid ABC transporter substrate-binding protein [Salinarimonas sp.]
MPRIAALLCCTLVAFAAFAPPVRAEPVLIGVAGPMSGPLATYGARMVEGVERAAEQINARGGLGGREVEIIIADDVADPTRVEAVADDLIRRGVFAVIGHFTSGTSSIAAPRYANADILLLTPTATDPLLTQDGSWNLFRLAPRDDAQAQVSGRFLATEYADRRVAIVHDKSAFGKGLADRTRQVMNDLGLDDTLYIGIDPGESGYATLIRSLTEAQIDAVYFGGMAEEAGIILRQMREAGLEATFVTGSGVISPQFAVVAGDAAEGALMTAAMARDAFDRPLEEAITAAGIKTGRHALMSFVALRALEEALDDVGRLDARAMAAHLRSGAMLYTEIGPIAFNSDGDVSFAEYGLFAWRRMPSGFIDYEDNLVAR